MTMQIHDVIQGSEEWLRLRDEYFTASEAPAMLGLSKYVRRDELLSLKKFGIDNTSEYARRFLFDKGHKAEAAIRPHIEQIIGEELYPCVGSDVVDGLPLLASFDGLTMLHGINFEHKMWNEELAAAVAQDIIPDSHIPQLEQQHMVSKAECTIFVVSDGTPDNCVYTWYYPDHAWRKRITGGWKQFQADKDTHEHIVEPEKPTATAIMELPALAIQISGEVKNTNLATFKDAATAFLKNIKTDLTTDQDFADAELTVKFCDKAEKQLDLVKQQALSQTAEIERLFSEIDQMKAAFRSKRLDLEKLVKNKKDLIRAEIVQESQGAFAAHIAQLNERLGGQYLPVIQADFAGAMKGKKTIVSLRGAANDELAARKIVANEIADTIEENLTVVNAQPEYMNLFPDLTAILTKNPEDFELLVNNRIMKHKDAENARIAKAEEDARMAAEEATRKAQLDAEAAKEAQAKAEADAQDARERAERQAQEFAQREEESRKQAEAIAAEQTRKQRERDQQELQDQARREREENLKQEDLEQARAVAIQAMIDHGIGKQTAKKVINLITEGQIPHIRLFLNVTVSDEQPKARMAG